MVNIKFPETDVVSCVFSLKNSTNSCNQIFDEFGVTPEGGHTKLKQYHYRVPAFLQGKLVPGDFVVVYCQTGYQICQYTTTKSHLLRLLSWLPWSHVLS